MMLVRDLVSMSFHNLLLHKMRSLLTSLGVIFGVGSVIAMLAISEGAKRSALAQIEAMGIDKIIVFSRRPPIDGKSENTKSDTRIFFIVPPFCQNCFAGARPYTAAIKPRKYPTVRGNHVGSAPGFTVEGFRNALRNSMPHTPL